MGVEDTSIQHSPQSENTVWASFCLIKSIPWWLSGKELAYQGRGHKRHGFNPRVRKIPWRRKWQPTPVFLQENPMDRGAWRATVFGFTKGWTWLKQLSMHTLILKAFQMRSWHNDSQTVWVSLPNSTQEASYKVKGLFLENQTHTLGGTTQNSLVDYLSTNKSEQLQITQGPAHPVGSWAHVLRCHLEPVEWLGEASPHLWALSL